MEGGLFLLEAFCIRGPNEGSLNYMRPFIGRTFKQEAFFRGGLFTLHPYKRLISVLAKMHISNLLGASEIVKILSVELKI